MEDKGDDTMERQELTKFTMAQVPDTIPELHDFILVGKEKLQAHKAKIRAIEKIGLAYGAKEAALSDAQDLADILLESERKLGELLDGIEGKKEFAGKQKGKGPLTSQRCLPKGITWNESHRAQTLFKNPEIVEEVKTRAREERFIPTSHKVYKEIKKREREDKEEEPEPEKFTERYYDYKLTIHTKNRKVIYFLQSLEREKFEETEVEWELRPEDIGPLNVCQYHDCGEEIGPTSRTCKKHYNEFQKFMRGQDKDSQLSGPQNYDRWLEIYGKDNAENKW
jgi:hypothetical protein